MFIADSNNYCIRKIDAASGRITGIFAVNDYVQALAIDATGTSLICTALQLFSHIYFVADYLYIAVVATNSVILKLDTTTNTAVTYAGGGAGDIFCCDGDEATSATLGGPNGVAVDSSGTPLYILVHIITANCHTHTGNVYIADFSSRILQVSTTGIITSIAGTGVNSYSGDGGAATSASFIQPFGVGVDKSGIIIEYRLHVKKALITSYRQHLRL